LIRFRGGNYRQASRSRRKRIRDLNPVWGPVEASATAPVGPNVYSNASESLGDVQAEERDNNTVVGKDDLLSRGCPMDRNV